MDLASLTNPNLVAVISVALTAGGMLGGLGGWFLRSKQEQRNIAPVLTMRGSNLEVMNRSSEPIIVTEIRAKGCICTSNWKAAKIWGDEDEPIFKGNRCQPNWEVPPFATCYFRIAVEDPSERSLRISIRSRLGTIRSSFKTAL